jgi:hypothetical protein
VVVLRVVPRVRHHRLDPGPAPGVEHQRREVRRIRPDAERRAGPQYLGRRMKSGQV